MQHLEGSGTPVLYIGRTVLKGLTILFYNEPDFGEDFFCPCLQQAIIVTLFSQSDFLT